MLKSGAAIRPCRLIGCGRRTKHASKRSNKGEPFDEDYQSLRLLFSTPAASPDFLPAFAKLEPQLICKMGLCGSASQGWLKQVASYIAAKIRANLTIRKELRPDIGSIYSITVHGMRKQIVLLADGFVVNFYARYEKGVKTEYIDPIVTMQMLGLVRLAAAVPPIEPGLYSMSEKLSRSICRPSGRAWMRGADRCSSMVKPEIYRGWIC